MAQADLRASLKAALEQLDDEQVGGLRQIALELWTDVLRAQKEQLVKAVAITCSHCSKTKLYDIPIPVPDLTTRMKGLDILMNQALGKPVETREVTVDVGERTLAQLEGMSMRELAELAGAVDAEFAELPPAAA